MPSVDSNGRGRGGMSDQLAVILCLIIFSRPGMSKNLETEEAAVVEEEPSNTTLSIVRWELRRIHASHILLLERDCFIEDCVFDRAVAIIGNTKQATRYWNLLNCVKYGNTCPNVKLVEPCQVECQQPQDECEISVRFEAWHGKWGPWSEFGPCSAKCGKGVYVRWRDCNSPHSMYEGAQCEGPDHEYVPCEFEEGPNCAFNPAIPGIWAEWGKWSHCTGDQNAEGFIIRRRMCMPNNVTEECEAYAEESLQCRRPTSNEDGGWSIWDPWTTCNSAYTCGTGVQTRRRKCSDPYVSGSGAKCMGASSETKECDGPACEEPASDIAHFVEGSYIRYKPIALSHYLNIFIKFMPNSDEGMIFQYSTLSGLHAATTSGSVKIKNPKVHAFVNIDEKKDENLEAKVEVVEQTVEVEDFVYAVLLSEEDLHVNISINGSDVIAMPFKGVRHGQWNELRISIISDMVWARFNDGENIEARLRAYTPYEEVIEVNETTALKKLVGTISNPIYGKIKSLILPEYRAILGEFEGEVGLGNVRGGQRSFRGYISHFMVNYNTYTFRLRPPSQISKLWDPARTDLVNYGIGRLSRLAEMSRFNGRESVEIPLIVSWIKDAPAKQPLGRTKNEIATFEFVLKPECEEGVFFLMQGAVNRFTHWKLSIEEFRKVRLAMSYGGDITIVKTRNDLHTGEWNRVVFQLVRKGEAQLDVNGHVYSAMIPTASATHFPSPIVHVGGFGKPIAHDREILGDDPSKAVLDQMRSFEGYIYSFRQDHRLYILQKHPQFNTFHMYSTLFMTKTPAIKAYYFLPTSEASEADTGERTHESARLWEKDSDKRALHCLVPLPHGAMELPNVTWYRTDQRIKNSAQMWTRQFKTQKSFSSVLYFGESLDSSHQHAGLYQCVMSYHGSSHIIATYAAVVVPEDISHYGAGGLGWFFRGYSMETSILMIVGILIGAIVTLLLLLSVIRFIIRKIKGPPKKEPQNVTSTDESAEEERRPGFADIASTARGAHTFKKKLKRRAKATTFPKIASTAVKAKLLRRKAKAAEDEENERTNLLGKKFGDKYRNKIV